MNCGIYQIRNTINQHAYIGSSERIEQRWRAHRSLLKHNKHHSPHLQNAWNKYGKESFIFEVIEWCSIDRLLSLEQAYIDKLKPIYNVCPQAANTKGRLLSDETKRKISISLRGNQYAKGLKFSAEALAKISAASKAQKRRPFTNETKEKIRTKASGRINCNGTAVERIDLRSGLVHEYPSIAEAVREGYSNGSIRGCLRGTCKQHKGYAWQYLETPRKLAKPR